MTTCLQCLGTGLASPTALCPVCSGSGQTSDEVSLTENSELLMQETSETPIVETPVEAPAEPVEVAEAPIEAPVEEVAPAAE